MSESDPRTQARPQPPPTIVVAAVDDHPVMLRGLAAAFAREPDLTLALVAPDCPTLLAADLTIIDVVLLDVELCDGTSAADNVRDVIAAGPAVILYTNEHRPAVITSALREGALGLVLKGDPENHVLEAVRAAAAGELYLSSRLAMHLVEDPVGKVRLSEREREVLERLAQGMSNALVAADLGISISSVRTYLNRVVASFVAAGVTVDSGPREAIAHSVRAGHIDPYGPPHARVP